MNGIDQTADRLHCQRPIEHYAGIAGSQWMTPYWRPADTERPHPHPVAPNPDTIRPAQP